MAGRAARLDRISAVHRRCLVGIVVLLIGVVSISGLAGAFSERSKTAVYSGEIVGINPGNSKPGNSYATFLFERKRNRVGFYLLGFCGEFSSGWAKIKNRKFRKSREFSNGFGVAYRGKFSRKGKRIKGYVRVWGPSKKKCDSGDRKFIATIGW